MRRRIDDLRPKRRALGLAGLIDDQSLPESSTVPAINNPWRESAKRSARPSDPEGSSGVVVPALGA
jgi:hypothetical protein